MSFYLFPFFYWAFFFLSFFSSIKRHIFLPSDKKKMGVRCLRRGGRGAGSSFTCQCFIIKGLFPQALTLRETHRLLALRKENRLICWPTTGRWRDGGMSGKRGRTTAAAASAAPAARQHWRKRRRRRKRRRPNDGKESNEKKRETKLQWKGNINQHRLQVVPRLSLAL